MFEQDQNFHNTAAPSTAAGSGNDKNRMTNLAKEEDRISQLPDGIRVIILSMLNPVEAATTCVLSKRWQYLWTHVQVLNFYFPNMMRNMEKDLFCDLRTDTDKYIHWVNQVIRLHQGRHITDFKVFFPLTGGEERFCDIDEWFSFAIRKSVQRLEINLRGSTLLEEGFERDEDGFFPVVPWPYTLADKVSSLVKSPCGLSCIKSLTQLSLTSINVTGELVEHFLSNCPLLLGLRVCFSERLVNLRVVGHLLCLKFLEISRCPRLKNLDIYAPNLASLVCLGLERSTRVLLRHAPLLVDLTVAHPEGFLNALPASHFSQLESLTLSFDFPWDTSAPPLFPELTNLKNLTFAGYAKEEHSFLDWTSLIERAPFLRTFTLQTLLPFSSKDLRRTHSDLQVAGLKKVGDEGVALGAEAGADKVIGIGVALQVALAINLTDNHRYADGLGSKGPKGLAGDAFLLTAFAVGDASLAVSVLVEPTTVACDELNLCDAFPHLSRENPNILPSKIDCNQFFELWRWSVLVDAQQHSLTQSSGFSLLCSTKVTDVTYEHRLMSRKRIRTQVRIKPTQRRLHRCLEVVKFVGNIDFELLVYFFQHAVPLKTIIVDRRHPSLEPWQEFEEDESSMELRNHGWALEVQLTPIPPKKIELVICP
ncbi:hypothetical protein RHSIM_Rhsim07G0191400 [Rhododendron simsii]|uniref:F-box domain-containing protein n=1 Tax=Rhododendron simsii TaxID=118357 RepID=A0A834GNC3_RHOSS|nr:hypothetical protein RHSIM_Rhsim07G0191400 [Rhododendron simsii]